MKMQSMVWCSTSPSTLKNSATTSGLAPDAFQTRREAATAESTSSRAWAYRLCTRPSRFTPCETTRCCAASGTSLLERGVQRCWGSEQVLPLAEPSTHAVNSGRPASAGPENTRHPSVNSGPRAVVPRSYAQYASGDTPPSSRNSSRQRWASEPVEASPSVRHRSGAAGSSGTPAPWKCTRSQKAGW